MAKWEGSAAFAARIEESVGHEPWFDYYRTMYPGYKNPPAAYTAFKTSPNVTPSPDKMVLVDVADMTDEELEEAAQKVYDYWFPSPSEEPPTT